MNFFDKDTAERTIVLLLAAGLSFITQLVGSSWLYSQLTGNNGLFQDLGFFEYIAAAWLAVALLVLLHDLVISYSFFNKKDLENKLIMIKSDEIEGLFLASVFTLTILVIPVIVYREKKGL